MTKFKLVWYACIVLLCLNPVYSQDQQKSNDKAMTCSAQPNAHYKIVAYYFHGTHRCSTCLALEKSSREAIDKYFQKELKNGLLEFKLINTDLKENEHYLQDYQLYTRSLVLVLYKDTKQEKWKNLPDIWTFVGDQKKFDQYVKEEIEKYLKEVC